MSTAKHIFPPITSLYPMLDVFPKFSPVSLPMFETHETTQISEKTTPTNTIIKNKFTPEEDRKLKEIVTNSKIKNWNEISALLGTRNARQCRERWNNYLNPELRFDAWTPEEDSLLLDKFAQFGTHWNKIAKCFNQRSDNAIRNRWQMLKRHYEKHNSAALSLSNSTSSD